MTHPFRVPTPADFGPALTDLDRLEMFSRALDTAPDLFDDEAVVAHCKWLGIVLTHIGGAYGAILDQKRAAARKNTFSALGDVARGIVGRLKTST